MEIVHWRFLINPLEEETDCGALTGRLSCGHSETGQTNRLNGNLDGQALTGRSKTALNSASSVHATSDLLRFADGFRTPVQCAQDHPF